MLDTLQEDYEGDDVQQIDLNNIPQPEQVMEEVKKIETAGADSYMEE